MTQSRENLYHFNRAATQDDSPQAGETPSPQLNLDWRQRYPLETDRRKRLLELRDKTRADLDDNELWQKACLLEEFVGPDEALVLFVFCQLRLPGNPDVAFAIGRLLHRQGDEHFLEHMKIALGRPELVADACRYAIDYLSARQRFAEADWWRARATAR